MLRCRVGTLLWLTALVDGALLLLLDALWWRWYSVHGPHAWLTPFYHLLYLLVALAVPLFFGLAVGLAGRPLAVYLAGAASLASSLNDLLWDFLLYPDPLGNTYRRLVEPVLELDQRPFCLHLGVEACVPWWLFAASVWARLALGLALVHAAARNTTAPSETG